MLGAVVVGGGVVALAAVPGLGKSVTDLFRTKQSEIMRYRVVKQKLPVTVVERGNLESSKNLDVHNEVEGQTTIIMIKPEGKRVQKGELVAELDSATLRDNLVNQEIVTKRASADYENAQKTLQVANIAVDEYLQGTLPQQKKTIEGQIALAESDKSRAEDRYKWSMDMKGKNYVAEGQVLSDKMALQKAEISLSNSKMDMDVLLKYSRKKQETELQANVKKAEADALAKKSTYELEKNKEEKLNKQIVKCKLYAPADGLLVYANDQNQMMRGMGSQSVIEEGATVRERQKIFSLPDIKNMRVNTKVHESMIDKVAMGQKSQIRVDAFASTLLDGTVSTVQPLPDAGNFMSSDVKVYTTHITIDKPLDGLRPGMTAQVEILVTQKDDVLAVPVQAIQEFHGKDYVYVLTASGPVRREVKVGINNDKFLEILDGLKVGDEVAMNPTALMTDEEKREAFSSSKEAGKSKDWGKIPAVSPGETKGADGKASLAKGGAGKGGAGKGGAGKGGMGKGGGAMPAIFSKIRTKTSKLSPDEQAQLKDFGLPKEEREALMRKAGVTDEELSEMQSAIMERMKAGGGFGGGPGGGGGGGFGGPGGGGSPQ